MPQQHETTDALWNLREAFARRTGTHARDWHLVFKARYGMREVFRTLREERGDGRVVTTLFTGCTAVDSITSSGLTPSYADIDPAILTVDAEALALDESVHAVIDQHSYGMIDEAKIAACAAKAHAAGALYVEDSAHCVARMARDASGAPLADISIHSIGIEKQLGVGFGGAIWVNPDMEYQALRDALTRAFDALQPLPGRIDAAAQHYSLQNRVLAHLPHGLSHSLRARLTASGRLEPPWPTWSAPDASPTRIPPEPADRPAHPRRFPHARRGRGMPQGMDPRLPRGAREPRRPRDPGRGVRRGARPVAHPLPYRAAERGGRRPPHRRAARLRLYCVDWYRMPFYPGALDLSAYGMSKDDPRYRAFRARYGGVVGLPTDIDIARLPEAVAIVRRHIERRA